MSENPPSLEDQIREYAAGVHKFAALLAASSARPTVVPIIASATADANGNALLAFPPVSSDRYHNLRRLVVGGVTWGTAAEGSAVVFIDAGGTNTPDVAVPLSQVVWSFSALPSVETFEESEILVAGGYSLQLQITGGTSGQQYIAAGSVTTRPY